MGKQEGRWEKGDRRRETGDRRRETGAGGQEKGAKDFFCTTRHEPMGTAHEYFKVCALLGRKNRENMVR